MNDSDRVDEPELPFFPSLSDLEFVFFFVVVLARREVEKDERC